jgi:hypothetical protein
VLPTGASAEVGGRPTATTYAGASAAGAEVGGAMVVYHPVLRGALPDGVATDFLVLVSL